ncbi:MAG: aspartate aminotransferase family protein [Planctomycetota bacterium]|jgi:glutamate/tyrosine decarboxylase-like PLP-dependent enzyme|nr:MAG: aspartate aminotransferase family protein [Planctomycetota bacterium]
MPAAYLDLVTALRQGFPQPVSDRVHDAYFVFSFLRALDQLDGMKSVSPLLGKSVELDYDAARRSRVDDDPVTLEHVTQTLVEHLSGMFIWGHPRAQINVIPPPTIASIIGGLLPSIYNPNLVSEESSRQVAVAEVEVSSMTADLIGYDPTHSAGLFTFGGTGTLLYGVKLGLEKACPGTARHGIRERAVIFCSERAHYACLSVASWLGIGQENVIQIPCSPDNEMRTCLLETMAREVLKGGGKIAAIVATMGTTDHFGLDDLKSIHEIRDRLVDEFHLDYHPHIHGDAVIGWAWSVFNDYDFQTNPLGFRLRTVRALAGTERRIRQLPLADSVGIDFHKTGFTPYVSSLFLVKDSADLELISRKQSDTPYLFHDGHYHPGRYTLETSRAGSAPMSALANLRLFGKNGLRALLGHVVSMAEVLREQLEGHAATTVVNRGNFGPVTLFRVYPDGVDTFGVTEREQQDVSYRDQLRLHNDYNRRIYQLVQADALQGEGVVISLTDCYRESDYGEPMVALKSYLLSPFAEEQYIDAVIESLWKARAQIASETTNIA